MNLVELDRALRQLRLSGMPAVLAPYAMTQSAMKPPTAAAGFGAMLLPPVTSEVDWSGAKGDE